jgi:LacI family transcriptional regulator
MNIVEFAKIADLSTATVSRAFHEPEKIRPATRQRVLDLADQLGYYPNASGRALVKGRHDVLGLVWPLEVEGAGAPFAQRILAALTQQLVSNDLDLLICPVDRRQPVTMEHARRTILRSRCDAWILLYPRHDNVLIHSLRTSHKPVICLIGGLNEYPDWKGVTLDQTSWIEDALHRLRKGGSRRVLFLGCRRQEPDHEERLAAFTTLAPKYFGTNFLTHPTWPVNVDEVAALLATKNIDAVIGVDDAAALIALRACKQADIAVPGKVQIIGIDDSAEAARATPSLATYRQPLDEMAACAVDLAMGRRVRSRKFTATFVPGGSVR